MKFTQCEEAIICFLRRDLPPKVQPSFVVRFIGVCVLRGLVYWFGCYIQKKKKKQRERLFKKRTKYYTKKQNLSHERFCDFYQKEPFFSVICL